MIRYEPSAYLLTLPHALPCAASLCSFKPLWRLERYKLLASTHHAYPPPITAGPFAHRSIALISRLIMAVEDTDATTLMPLETPILKVSR